MDERTRHAPHPERRTAQEGPHGTVERHPSRPALILPPRRRSDGVGITAHACSRPLELGVALDEIPRNTTPSGETNE